MFYMSFSFFLSNLIFIQIFKHGTLFFHAMHLTSALLSQPWTTSTNTWQRLVRTSSFRRPSVPRLLSERKLLIATTTKRTTRMFIGLRWVGPFFSSFYFFHSSNLQLYTPIINFNISRKRDGRMDGFKPLTILSVQNSIELMLLWM